MTVDYLRDSCGLHNVLYAYSPDRSRIDMSSESTCEAGYLYAYPGDDYVDVLGFDDYWDIAPADVEAERPRERHDDLITMLTVVGRLAVNAARSPPPPKWARLANSRRGT